MPRELMTPPRESLMATMRAFFSAKSLRDQRAGVAESLNRDARAAQRYLLHLAGLFDHHEHSARGGFLAPFGSSDRYGLAGHDAERRVSLVME